MLCAAFLWAVAASAAASDIAQLEQSAFTAAVDAVADSVVQIQTVGGLDTVENRELALGPTTGLVASADGYIVASAFGFAQEPTSIIVLLANGRQLPAELIGRDTNRMLVLLKVDADEALPTPQAAKLDEVRPGDWSIAVGRTYGIKRPSMSVGVVSAVNRMYGRAVQTDANVSASNYGGPLVDIHGRVLGVLAPMAPQAGGSSETAVLAGAEFYDSGIGFAVPWEDVLNVLDRWKEVRDLKRGLLGVSLKSGNPHSTRPLVTAVWPGSPAAKAGWKADDQIIAVDGKKVETQTQLRFRVVPHYAGDVIRVTLRRGKGSQAEELETEITLADKLPAFRHAFLGVLPERGDDADEASDEDINHEADGAQGEVKPNGDSTAEQSAPEDAESKAGSPSEGVTVAAVWPGSPAAAGGVEPGDRIVRLGKDDIASVSQALARLNAKNPDDGLQITLLRSGQELELDVRLAGLPTEILSESELPQRRTQPEPHGAGELHLQELRLPEMSQTARYYQPPDDAARHGILVWLGDAGEDAAKSLAAAWQEVCDRDGLILLAPEPSAAAGWAADDLEYLGRLLQTAVGRFKIDPYRVVIAGEGRGGQLAYTLAFGGRRLVRGVAVVDSPLPRTLELPENSANERLAVLSIETQDTPLTMLIHKDLERITAAGYPATIVTRRPASDNGTSLTAAARRRIARWIDALDRF